MISITIPEDLPDLKEAVTEKRHTKWLALSQDIAGPQMEATQAALGAWKTALEAPRPCCQGPHRTT